MKNKHFDIKRPDDFVPIPDQILDETIIPQFERIVSLYPNRLAIKSSEHKLSYQELNNAANSLANEIIQVVGNEIPPIAYLFSDEVYSIIAILAILKSGRPFVGIHPGNSPDLISGILEDSRADILITNSSVTQKLGKGLNVPTSVFVLNAENINMKSKHHDPAFYRSPTNLIGLFYTSGSTGLSKGVMCNHVSRAQTIQYMVNEWFISPSDHISLLTSVCYLASFPSLFGALLTGALLCIFDLKANSAQKALDWIIKEELTIFRSTPTIFRAIFSLIPKDRVFSKLRFMTLGGETVTDTDIKLFKALTNKDCVLINNYSSTETGTICHYPVGHDTCVSEGILPAGYPAPGKEVILVDGNGDKVDDLQEGEIAVRSKYLNLGYQGKPELTAQKFHKDPEDPNFRIYYTGDRGRWREDGALIILGREDTQVKVRGYRIQLEAIDHALINIDEIENAVTIVYKTPRNGDRLVSYFVASDQESVSISRLRKKLSVLLPSFMVPSILMQIDSLPMTATGKPVRSKLPTPTMNRPNLETAFIGPRTKNEEVIVQIWKDILQLDKVGINDNFFELGGDSLIALEMTLEVESALSKAVPQTFFANPIVSNLAQLLSDSDLKDQLQSEFVLESYKSSPSKSDLKKNDQSGIKKLLTRRYSLDDLDHVIDKVIGNHLVNLPYLEALQWSEEWSQKEWARKLLYKRRFDLYSRWLEGFKIEQTNVQNGFQMNLQANMQFRLPRPQKKSRKSKSEFNTYLQSPYLYWRTLGDLIESTPMGEFNEYFPIINTDNLMKAYRKGKGVILVSFHGTPRSGSFAPLRRLLQVNKLPTISYQIPVRQSQFHDQKERRSEVAAATLNAEIALFGQKHLMNGGIINFASDTNDLLGRTYKVSVGSRIHQYKGGFAELAMNTNATIIPFSRYCLQDGRLQLEFGEPLLPGNGDRHEKIEGLVNDYASFIEVSCKTHPEAMSWARMKLHLELDAV